MRTVRFRDLPQLAGVDLGCSDWFNIDQRRIDLFADATDDHQWIHCDVERAERERGGTIAHGFMTLSLLPRLSVGMLEVTDVSHALNFGLNRLRFTAPVKCGARIRLCQKVLDVTLRGEGYQITIENRFEVEGVETPVCIAESLGIYYP